MEKTIVISDNENIEEFKKDIEEKHEDLEEKLDDVNSSIENLEESLTSTQTEEKSWLQNLTQKVETLQETVSLLITQLMETKTMQQETQQETPAETETGELIPPPLSETILAEMKTETLDITKMEAPEKSEAESPEALEQVAQIPEAVNQVARKIVKI